MLNFYKKTNISALHLTKFGLDNINDTQIQTTQKRTPDNQILNIDHSPHAHLTQNLNLPAKQITT